MTNPVEQLERSITNGDFYDQFRFTLHEHIKGIQNLRVLDYGSGNISLFLTLKAGQATVAYDPQADMQTYHRAMPDKRKRVIWINEAPHGELFDLVVCYFSMHHMGQPPDMTVRQLLEYQPRLLAIGEYDYTKATQADFDNTFVSESEQKELEEMFDGDQAACFAYHNRLGQEQYRRAFEENGFNIVRQENGHGVASNKFFIVGKRK